MVCAGEAAQVRSAPRHHAAPNATLAAPAAHEKLFALEAAADVLPVVSPQHADQSLQHPLSVAHTHTPMSPPLRSLPPRGLSRGARRRGLSYSRIPAPVSHSLLQASHLPRMAGSTPGDVPRSTHEERVVPRLRPGPFHLQCHAMKFHAVQSLFLRSASRSKCFQQY